MPYCPNLRDAHRFGSATRRGHHCRHVRLASVSIVETLGLETTEVVSVVWRGQPADTRDKLDLVDVYGPELDLLDDLDEWED